MKQQTADWGKVKYFASTAVVGVAVDAAAVVGAAEAVVVGAGVAVVGVAVVGAVVAGGVVDIVDADATEIQRRGCCNLHCK